MTMKNLHAVKNSDLDFPVVGLGASNGGLKALLELFAAIPVNNDMAFVIVLHLSSEHESNFPQLLQKVTSIPVRQVVEAIKIEKDTIYVIPPAKDLLMEEGMLIVSDLTRTMGQHVAIDLFFRTLADAHMEHAVGIILSGSGSDGAVGITRIKEQGGITIVQEPGDAEFDAMPASAVATGIIDFVLPLKEIAPKLIELKENISKIQLLQIEDRYLTRKSMAENHSNDTLNPIMELLRERTAHDFSHYKRATVLRRIERRMQVNCVTTLKAYFNYLEEQPEEARHLLQDLLISVTNFFRDSDCYYALQQEIIPKIFSEADPGAQIRAWSAGCATGEEAYSIAMLMAEYRDEQSPAVDIQVFATDIDEHAIAVGRKGLYPESIAADIEPGRLTNFFIKKEHHYQIKKGIREKVLFASRNILRDPPFTRVHLITCRNLLIYLSRDVQQHIFEMFHFALLPGGYLFLGNSESAEVASKYFVAVDKKNRIYRALITPRVLNYASAFLKPSGTPLIQAKMLQQEAKPATGYAELHRKVLEEYAPPSVLVDKESNIVFSCERAGHYLRYVGGEPSRNLLTLIIPELRLELRTALFQVAQLEASTETRAVRLSRNGKELHIGLTVRTIKQQDAVSPLYLVLFNEVELDDAVASLPPSESSSIVSQLEDELALTKEQLQQTIEQYETSSEELRASNEELQAINEELHSTTEELEISKEELQSINEELSIVNQELKGKVDETGKSHDDLQNFIASTEIATIFVDRSLRIKRFTPHAADIFNLIATDIGRPLLDITHRLHYQSLETDASSVFETLSMIEREVGSDKDEWFIARLIPYRTNEDRIDGLVLTFIDITSLHNTEKQLLKEEQRMRLIAASTKDYAIFTFDVHGNITSWNCGAQSLFGYNESEVLGKPTSILFTDEDQAQGIPEAEIRTALDEGTAEDERWHLRQDGSKFYSSGVTSVLEDPANGFAKIARDLTVIKEEESRREILLEQESETRKKMEIAAKMRDEFFAVLSHELKQPLNLINMNAEMLKRVPEVRELPKVLEAAEVIRGAAQTQATLINDLLDLSRAQTGKLYLDKKQIDLVPILQRVILLFAEDIANNNLNLTQTIQLASLHYYADGARFEQIIWNLICNAIKFTQPGGDLHVQLLKDEHDYVLTVEDSGKGIEKHYLPFIFEMFNQAESGNTRTHGGMGIGLALAKELVESHGGHITASSEGLGKGAQFTIRLPVTPEMAPAPSTREAGEIEALEHVLEGKNILIVDDDKLFLLVFGDLLAACRANYVLAESGKKALEEIRSQKFDLVISDIAMPEMDGYQLLSEIKKLDPALPVITLTGFGRAEDINKALAAGFIAHLGKPVVMTELLKKVHSILHSGG
jgi:two-component system, chemotaxis family, CheB/CheR fusion protein